MKKIFHLWTLLALCLFSLQLNAQTPKKLKVQGTGIYFDNRVLLRWAPADYDTWQWCNKRGYRLERYIVAVNGEPISVEKKFDSRTVLAESMRPATEDEWKSLASFYPIAGVGAAALYSEEFTVQAGNSEYMKAYNKNLEKENRFNFMLFAADQERSIARAAGMQYEEEVNTEYQYEYVVIPNTEPEEDISINAAYISIDPSQPYELPQIQNIVASPGDLTVMLSWNRGNLDKYYSSYIVEKADENGQFQRVNEDPLVPTSSNENDKTMFFGDQLKENNKPYYYRIVGKSHFGILGEYSEKIEVIGKPKPLDASPFISKVFEKNQGALTIQWTFPEEKLKQIKSYSIYKCDEIDGEYQTLAEGLAIDTQEFEDADIPKGSSYYIVRAYDENDNALNSFASLGQLKDETPPVPPSGLKCQGDNTGKIALAWDANNEQDIMGYRVFFSNDENRGFAQITKTHTIANSYEDNLPLNVLNETIYYKVIAVDYHQNYSKMSAACTAARPDVIPPSSAVLFQAEATMKGIEMEWIKSSSNDVARHELQRKSDGQSDWTILLSIQKQDTTNKFIDSTAQKSYTHAYRVVAFDNAKNKASSNVMEVVAIRDPSKSTTGTGTGGNGSNTGGTGGTGGVQGNIQYTTHFNPDYIELNWSYSINTGNEYFVIYRMDSLSKTPIYLAQVSPGQTGTKNLFTYKDNLVIPGMTYTYEVQLCGVQKICTSFGKAVVLFDPKAGSGGSNNSTKAIDINATGIASNTGKGITFDWIYYPQTATESLEIYRGQAGKGGATKMGTIPMTGKGFTWTFTDSNIFSSAEYDYTFLHCDGQTVNCSPIAQTMKIDYRFTNDNVVIIKSYNNDYIELEWNYDLLVSATQYFEVTKIDANGNKTIIGQAIPLISGQDFKIKDANVTPNSQYIYSIELCTPQSTCVPVYTVKTDY